MADAGDDSGSGDGAPLLIHFVGSPKSDFEKRRSFVEQMTDAFAHRQSPHFSLTFLTGFAAAFTQNCFFFQDRFAKVAERFSRRFSEARHKMRKRLNLP